MRLIRLPRPAPRDTHRIPQQMSQEDYRIFLAWRHDGLRTAINVYYDVKLGMGKPCDPSHDETMQKCWADLTCRRADMIVEYEKIVEIIELKYDAEPSSVGRLLLYRLLWKQDPPIKKTLILRLISDRDDADIKLLSLAYNFYFTVIPTAAAE